MIVFIDRIQVDLLEPVSHFLDAAREHLAPGNPMASDTHQAMNFICLPLQVTCFKINKDILVDFKLK